MRLKSGLRGGRSAAKSGILPALLPGRVPGSRASRSGGVSWNRCAERGRMERAVTMGPRSRGRFCPSLASTHRPSWPKGAGKVGRRRHPRSVRYIECTRFGPQVVYATNPKFGKVKCFRGKGLTGVFCPTGRGGCPDFRLSFRGALKGRTRNPSHGSTRGPMDSGPACSRTHPGMTGRETASQ